MFGSPGLTGSFHFFMNRLQAEWAGLPQLHPLSPRSGYVIQSLLPLRHGEDEVTVAEPATPSEVRSNL